MAYLKRSVGTATLFALLVMFLSVGLFAQTETGQINGVVTDPNGNVIVNATVTVVSTTTKATRSVTTGSDGSYTITNLQPSVYEVTVVAKGFGAAKKQVQVTVGSRVAVEVKMSVAGETTTVEVIGEGGVQVETAKSELSEAVTVKQITGLPTFNRNAYALINLVGNVSDGGGVGAAGRGLGVAINGQRSASTGITLDGAENVDNFTATLNQAVPLDSVQEFRVVTSNFSAEYGRASGGVVNVATRSGTNSFHGTLFESYRGSGLSANTFDNNANGIEKPRYVRNQFGYSIGGPVIKDKLFFFHAAEFIRVRSSATQRALVADPAFIAAADPATQAFYATFGSLATPIKSVIRKSDFSVTGVPVGGLYAGLPANTAIFDEVEYKVPTDAGGGQPQDQYLVNTRIDYNATDKTSIFGRYSIQRANQFAGSISDSPYSGFSSGSENYGGNALISVTHVFKPNMVSQTKFAYNRSRADNPLGSQPFTPTLYFRNVTTRISTPDGSLRVAGPGYIPYNPGSAIPFAGPQNVYQLNQDVSWTIGKHQLRFGGQYVHMRDNRFFGAFANSAQNLSTSSTGVALENFLRGQLAQFQGAVDPQGKFPCTRDNTGAFIINAACQVVTPLNLPDFSRNNRFNDYAFYFNDAWQLTSRLTVNLGVRYEYYGVQRNIDPNQDSNFYYGAGANLFEQIRNGQVFATPNSPKKGLWAPDRNNFAPRVGVAWDVFGNGKTSLRGGYGISYERNFGNVTFNVLFNPPFFAAISINSADVAGNLPVTTDNAGPLGGVAGVTKNLTNLQVRHIDENIVTAYAHQWDFAVEQQLLQNTVATLSYSGSKGVGLYSLENPNKPGTGVIYLNDDPAVGSLLTGRMNRQYTNLNTRRNNGSSNYHALNLGLRSNNPWKSGLYLRANYTFAKALDNLSSTFSDSANNYNLGLLDPFNPGLDRGQADFDIKHRFVVSGSWEVPWFKNSDNWALKYAVGGWTFAPIITAQTGSTYTIFDCSNTGGISQVCPRIIPTGAFISHTDNQDRGPNNSTFLILPSSTAVVNPVFGTSDFGLCARGQGAAGPCAYPAGMSQRNAFRRPGIRSIDFAASKTFKMSERFSLQFRGELFNIFNHPNLYVGSSTSEVLNDSDVDAPNGRVTSSRADNRNIQLGVKIIF
ncbi:MAG: TonB-dependent receptor [Acidobacteriales bacterium]|nr:TonB-dependent receptor [Terriglobales bacterium]